MGADLYTTGFYHAEERREAARLRQRVKTLEDALREIGVDIHMAKAVDIAYLDLANEKIDKLGLSDTPSDGNGQ